MRTHSRILFLLQASLFCLISSAYADRQQIEEIIARPGSIWQTTTDGARPYQEELALLCMLGSQDAYTCGDGCLPHLERAGFDLISVYSTFGESEVVRVVTNFEERETSEIPVDLQYFVATRTLSTERRVILIGVRGTSSATDVISDANFLPSYPYADPEYKLHRGFHANAVRLKETLLLQPDFLDGKSFAEIASNIAEGTSDDIICLTGHSLGGAIATIVGTDLRRGDSSSSMPAIPKENLLAYTFGAPPVGNASFVNQFAGEGGEQLSDLGSGPLGFHLFRVRNDADPIPFLGLPDRHVGFQVVYQKDGTRVFGDVLEPINKSFEYHRARAYLASLGWNLSPESRYSAEEIAEQNFTGTLSTFSSELARSYRGLSQEQLQETEATAREREIVLAVTNILTADFKKLSGQSEALANLADLVDFKETLADATLEDSRFTKALEALGVADAEHYLAMAATMASYGESFEPLTDPNATREERLIALIENSEIIIGTALALGESADNDPDGQARITEVFTTGTEDPSLSPSIILGEIADAAVIALGKDPRAIVRKAVFIGANLRATARLASSVNQSQESQVALQFLSHYFQNYLGDYEEFVADLGLDPNIRYDFRDVLTAYLKFMIPVVESGKNRSLTILELERQSFTSWFLSFNTDEGDIADALKDVILNNPNLLIRWDEALQDDVFAGDTLNGFKVSIDPLFASSFRFNPALLGMQDFLVVVTEEGNPLQFATPAPLLADETKAKTRRYNYSFSGVFPNQHIEFPVGLLQFQENPSQGAQGWIIANPATRVPIQLGVPSFATPPTVWSRPSLLSNETQVSLLFDENEVLVLEGKLDPSTISLIRDGAPLNLFDGNGRLELLVSSERPGIKDFSLPNDSRFYQSFVLDELDGTISFSIALPLSEALRNRTDPLTTIWYRLRYTHPTLSQPTIFAGGRLLSLEEVTFNFTPEELEQQLIDPDDAEPNVNEGRFLGEYFFNNDPGVANGYFFITDTSGRRSLKISSRVINNLPTGMNTIGVRVKAFGEDVWSTTDFRTFFKLDISEITLTPEQVQPVAYEFFIDEDPGVDRAFSARLESDATSSITVPASLLQNLDNGVHFIGVRVRDLAGRWSTTDFRSFYKLNVAEISEVSQPVAGEYFLNVDPGVGRGIGFSLSGDGQSLLNLSQTLVRQLPTGVNFIGVRVRDERGRWSTTDFRVFYKLEQRITEDPRAGLLSSINWRILDANGLQIRSGRWRAGGRPETTLLRKLDTAGLTVGQSYQLEVSATDGTGFTGPRVIHAFIAEVDPLDPDGDGIINTTNPADYSYSLFQRRQFAPARDDTPIPFRSTFFDDADGDGLTNGFEYYYGTDPLISDARPLKPDLMPLPADAEEGENYLSIRIEEVVAASGNVQPIVECATSLEPDKWVPVQRPPVEISNSGGKRTLRYFDDEPISQDSKRFMRVRIQSPTLSE